jgi:1,4-alpha-glucan branching enzyme
MLAGNFNDWRPDKLSMKKTSDGWELPYVLGPGNYQYKFIVDGRWMTDPANASIVNDGRGNRNSFMVIGANFVFKLKGYDEARDVFLAGDFNNWSPQGLRMEREDDYWKGHVYLAKGKHLYYFIVDGKITKDPANKDWEGDGWGPPKSVIWIDPNDL